MGSHAAVIKMWPGSRRPGRVTKRRKCFGCGVTAPEANVLHFNLMLPTYPNGTARRPVRNRGAGTIDMCESCWAKAKLASFIRRGKPKRVA